MTKSELFNIKNYPCGIRKIEELIIEHAHKGILEEYMKANQFTVAEEDYARNFIKSKSHDIIR